MIVKLNHPQGKIRRLITESNWKTYNSHVTLLQCFQVPYTMILTKTVYFSQICVCTLTQFQQQIKPVLPTPWKFALTFFLPWLMPRRKK